MFRKRDVDVLIAQETFLRRELIYMTRKGEARAVLLVLLRIHWVQNVCIECLILPFHSFVTP